MFKVKYTLIILFCALWSACSVSDGDDCGCDGRGDPATGYQTRVNLSTNEDDVSVYVFRNGASGYLFTESFDDNWTVEDDRFTREETMDEGEYYFLFAKGFGDKLMLTPAQPAASSGRDDLKFVLQQQSPGVYGSCDELYLAEKQWNTSGSKIIEATLTRAVSRIDINLGRGVYNEGFTPESDYEPVPYGAGEAVTDHIDRIEMTVTGVGNTIARTANTGSVTLVWKAAAAQYEILTDEGFARYEGPYFIPTEQDININIKVIPVDEVNYPTLTKDFNGLRLSRNEKLTLNLWLSKLYLTIGVTAETSPIVDVREGDSGLWD